MNLDADVAVIGLGAWGSSAPGGRSLLVIVVGLSLL